jgi:hypothetical protein
VRLGGRCTRFSSHTHRDRVLQVTSASFKARRVNPKNFFAELKRRNVYKVAVAYAIVGWLVMQIAATVVPALHLSDAVTSAVVLLVILSFPIALVIAWALELTPEGIKRTDQIETGQRSRNRAWIYIVSVAGAISVSLFLFGRYTASSKQSGSVELPTKSIAVLPFENFSEDKALPSSPMACTTRF